MLNSHGYEPTDRPFVNTEKQGDLVYNQFFKIQLQVELNKLVVYVSISTRKFLSYFLLTRKFVDGFEWMG